MIKNFLFCFVLNFRLNFIWLCFSWTFLRNFESETLAEAHKKLHDHGQLVAHGMDGRMSSFDNDHDRSLGLHYAAARGCIECVRMILDTSRDGIRWALYSYNQIAWHYMNLSCAHIFFWPLECFTNLLTYILQ